MRIKGVVTGHIYELNQGLSTPKLIDAYSSNCEVQKLEAEGGSPETY